MPSLRKGNSLRANTASQALPLFAGYGLNLATTPIVVTHLGVKAFGIWAMTGALAQYGALLDLGISRSVTRFVALHHARGDTRREGTVLSVALAGLLCLTAVLFVVGLGAASVVQRIIPTASVADLRVLIGAATIILMTTLLGRAVSALAFGRGRMVGANVALSVSAALVPLAGAVVVVRGSDLRGFAVASALAAVAGFAVVTLAIVLMERGIPLARPSRAVAAEMLEFGLKGQTILVSDLVVFQTGKLVLGALFGPGVAGIYELGSRLALGGRTIGALMSSALTPTLTAAFVNTGVAGVGREVDRINPKVMLAACAAPAFVGATSPALVVLWLGSPSNPIVEVVAALSAAFVLNVATGVATVAAGAMGRPGLSARAALLATLVFLVCVYPFALSSGSSGVLAATAVATLAGAGYNVVLFQRAVDAHPYSYLTAAVPALVCVALASSAAALLATSLSPTTRAEAVPAFLGSAALFAGLYASCLLFWLRVSRVRALV